MENKKIKIAVAGTGYVGLSIATLLSQHHEVVAVDVVPEKVELINSRRSPIQDEYIEKYLAEKELNLKATTDGEEAYKDANFVVIATPTNYDPVKKLLRHLARRRSHPSGDAGESRCHHGHQEHHSGRLHRKHPPEDGQQEHHLRS